jgi:peptidoglycan-associated lipoprotein
MKNLVLVFITSIILASCSSKKNSTQSDVTLVISPINIAKVHFLFDSSELKLKAKNLILSKIDLIKSANLPIIIEGHADARGSEDYNKILGENRAKCVKDFLVKNGINSDLITIVSFGKNSPEDKRKSEKAYRLNRRAVIIINS